MVLMFNAFPFGKSYTNLETHKCCLIIIHISEIWINKTTPSTASKYILFQIFEEITNTTIFVRCDICYTIKDDAFFYF